jgi:site-specific DNA recombinase
MFDTNNTPIRVAFYVRVSTDEQKNGFGAEMQLQGLQEMMTYRSKHHNWVTDKEWVYQDLWCTGADLNRPQFKEMMKDSEAKKFDMIAVWKIDRLSRNLSHLLSTFEILQSYKVGFFSLKENIDFTGPIGKLTFQIFWALAEFERETIKTRTHEGKMASARLGNYVINSAPFWYIKESKEKRRNRSLLVVDREAIWVKRVYDEYIGGKTTHQIATLLNENKVRKGDWINTKDKTTQWHYSDVKKIIERTVYIGRAVYESKNDRWQIDVVDIAVPRIVSDIVYELAQHRTKQLEWEKIRGWWKNEYLLSRKIIDFETGKKFVWVSRTKDGRHSYRRKLFIRDGKEYKNLEIPGEILDNHVWNNILQFLWEPQKFYDVFKRQSVDSRDYDTYLQERDRLQREYEKLDNAEVDIEMEYRAWEMSEDKRDKTLEKIQERQGITLARIKELDEKLDAIIRSEDARVSLEKFTENFETNLEKITLEQKKHLINILVEKIEVTATKTSINPQIVFRFVQSPTPKNNDGYQPKKLSANSKTDGEEPDIDDYGATSRTWTYDLLLRREAF